MQCDVAAVLVDQGAGYGQPQPHAGGFCVAGFIQADKGRKDLL